MVEKPLVLVINFCRLSYSSIAMYALFWWGLMRVVIRCALEHLDLEACMGIKGVLRWAHIHYFYTQGYCLSKQQKMGMMQAAKVWNFHCRWSKSWSKIWFQGSVIFGAHTSSNYCGIWMHSSGCIAEFLVSEVSPTIYIIETLAIFFHSWSTLSDVSFVHFLWEWH